MVVITALSLILAAVMTAVAWRVARQERRRSEARVLALASAIHDDAEADFFTTPRPTAAAASHVAVAVALGVCVVAAAAAFVVVSGSNPIGTSAAPALETSEKPPASAIDLIALAHAREGDMLTVRGIVRNPVSAAEVDGLTAIVFVFNHDGGFLTSGRAAVAAPALLPGSEAPFTVTVPAAGDVDRYRVSFRTAGRIVPHVDRRDRSGVAHLP